MKKLFIVICTVATMVSCSNREAKTENTPKKIKIESEQPCIAFTGEKKQSIGKVNRKEQQYVDVEYEFENTGNKPLVIIKADVSCGCMTVDYTKQPIKKGGKGYVKVKIDTKNQEGDFNKSVFIKSNATNNIELLRIVGKIK